MSAVDDRGITISDVDTMQSIGADQAKMPVNTNMVDMRAHFGGAHGPGFQPGGPAIKPAEIQPELQQQQPDLWANTGPQRNPVLDGVDQVSNNMAGAGPSMNGNVKMDGAGYLANSVGGMAVELFGALSKEMETAPQQEFAYQAPQYRPGLFG